MLGNIVYEISKIDYDLIQKNAEEICKFYDSCIKSECKKTRFNCAYNLPCIFDLFAGYSKSN